MMAATLCKGDYAVSVMVIAPLLYSREPDVFCISVFNIANIDIICSIRVTGFTISITPTCNLSFDITCRLPKVFKSYLAIINSM